VQLATAFSVVWLRKKPTKLILIALRHI